MRRFRGQPRASSEGSWKRSSSARILGRGRIDDWQGWVQIVPSISATRVRPSSAEVPPLRPPPLRLRKTLETVGKGALSGVVEAERPRREREHSIRNHGCHNKFISKSSGLKYSRFSSGAGRLACNTPSAWSTETWSISILPWQNLDAPQIAPPGTPARTRIRIRHWIGQYSWLVRSVNLLSVQPPGP
jgi:hypothetical protein